LEVTTMELDFDAAGRSHYGNEVWEAMEADREPETLPCPTLPGVTLRQPPVRQSVFEDGLGWYERW
jgi:hypothetical protein